MVIFRSTQTTSMAERKRMDYTAKDAITQFEKEGTMKTHILKSSLGANSRCMTNMRTVKGKSSRVEK